MGIYNSNKIREIIKENQVINEAYFGETPGIKEMQRLITEIRKEITILKSVQASSFSNTIKFNRAVEKEFGFHTFALNIVPDQLFNAFTFPISNRLDVFNTNKKLSIKKSNVGFKFEKNIYIVKTYITSGILLDKRFTDREVLAIILHEIGHSFSTSYYNNSLFSVTSQVLTSLMYIMYSLQKIALDLSIEELLLSLSSMSNFVQYIIDPLDKLLRKNKVVSSILGITIGGFNLIRSVSFEMLNIMSTVTNLFSILSLPVSIPLALVKAFNKINIFSIFSIGASYRDEQLADNFATLYGYGAEIGSSLEKLEHGSKGLKSSEFIRNNAPGIYLLSNITNDTISLLLHPIQTHPKTIARINNQIEMLEKELDKENMDPKMRKAMKEDIDGLKKTLNKYDNFNVSKKLDPDSFNKALSLFLYKSFGGDIREAFVKEKSYDYLDKAVNNLKKK